MQASFPAPKQRIYHSFPPNYFNQNLPNQINFINFPHFQNETHTKTHSSPSPFPSLPSSQTFDCKQENHVNFQNQTPPPAKNSPLYPENIKTESFIQPKCEDEPIHDFSSENQGFPVKFEVKKEDAQPSSILHSRSKKISKDFSSHLIKADPSKNITQYQKKIRRTWSPEEDVQLLELVKKYGTKWAKIASFMESRNGKQVRDHYLNALTPDINRGVWTEEEDKAILFYYKKFGAQWCRIAECLDGRTETQVKGRFYTNLKQKLMVKKNEKVEIVIEEGVKKEEF